MSYSKIFSTVLAAGILLGALAATPLTAQASTYESSGNEVETYDNLPEDNSEYTTLGGVSVAVGETKSFSSHIRYSKQDEDAYDTWKLSGSVTWTSANSDIASVDSSGKVTGKRVGTTRITATGWDGTGRKHVQTFSVGVRSASSALSTDPAASIGSVTVLHGRWLDLGPLFFPDRGSGDSLVWSVRNESVAGIDSAGLVTTNGVGSTTVTATLTDAQGKTAAQQITVRVVSNELYELTQSCTLSLKSGQTLDLAAMLYPAMQDNTIAMNKLSCTTTDSSVAAVSGKTVTAKSSGTCSVLITEKSGYDEQIVYNIKLIVS